MSLVSHWQVVVSYLLQAISVMVFAILPLLIWVNIMCAEMTSEFLSYSLSTGNDLTTPLPEHGFPGLQPGDFWCICVTRWVQAYQDGQAPRVKAEACHQAVLSYVPLDVVMEYAV